MPLYPFALKHLKVDADVDCLLTLDASVVKGMAVPRGIPHVCYCCSPPRYLFELQDQYLDNMAGMNGIKRTAIRALTPQLQRFDRKAAQGVDRFITLSRFIQERIRRCYDRDSSVIYPPVSVADFTPRSEIEDFYLVVSQLVPYKRIDLAVAAFNKLGKRLVVIGQGSELGVLQSRAGKNVTFLGGQPFPVLKEYYEKCRAFIFPGIEDFGITILEAQAAGRPVIAYREGGALETIVEGQTGLFFDELTADSLGAAVLEYERREGELLSKVCRANAERFRPERFREEMKDFFRREYPHLFGNYHWPL
jgi:glycosyltransferase involved in cell wall biosynthesis